MPSSPGGQAQSFDQRSNAEETLDNTTDSDLVMAEQTTHDVVNHSGSVGEYSPSDVHASTSNLPAADGAADSEPNEATQLDQTNGQTDTMDIKNEEESQTSLQTGSDGAVRDSKINDARNAMLKWYRATSFQRKDQDWGRLRIRI